MSCPVCGGQARPALRLPDRDVYACQERGCTLRFAHPQPSDVQLDAFYARHYYGEGEPTYENSPEASLRQLLRALQADTGTLTAKRVLDYGCGIGTFCKLMLAEGAHVDATEPDPVARAAVARDLGITVVADLESFREKDPGQVYDLITMVDVVEHLRAPIDTLTQLASLLKPGGTVFIETPDAHSLRARLTRERWENYQNPTHLYYFNWRSLERTLREAGFTRNTHWRPLITYPSHGTLRRLAQAALQRLDLDGALRALARAS